MVKKLDTYINSNRTNIEKEIENWVTTQLLDDDSKYYTLPSINEVYDISVVYVKVSYNKYLLTYMDKNEYIATEMDFEISYQVDILTDDEDTMYKDDDTKEWKYFETTNVSVKDRRNVKADVIFYLENSKINDFEVEKVNKGKDLIIRSGKMDEDGT
ncbi:hypothetical protein [Capnocytophaga stomatis]|uniref:Uncharacterized protein n=1 Tax=Capnocytophaga stomatis TaxID=1848904 RepID=A0ABW8QCK8_9FLAO|nr:hypothetical protein [Capnocytophaga stomatis]GIJ92845.1 hypothetical protein CAPN002_00630 [Capnocytophaga stomatis]